MATQQLILDVGGMSVLLPEAKHGKYLAWEDPGTVQIEMISRRLVAERRGLVWNIKYECQYLVEEMKNRVIAASNRGRQYPILCSFLPPNGTELIQSTFLVTDFTPPSYQWTKRNNGDPLPLWSDYAVTLREVRAHA